MPTYSVFANITLENGLAYLAKRSFEDAKKEKETPKVNQEFLDQLAQEAQDELAFVEAKKAIWEGLGKLYQAWAIHGPEDGYTINMLNNLMLLYDEWLD